jgi:hypothetical protein
MISGGANTLIEVIRHTIRDAAKLLDDAGQEVPRKLKLQFDNCGEQKVI